MTVRSRNNSTQFILSVVISVIAVCINYTITLIVTPYITENIGVEAYGFVSLAKTFANYASIFTIALNSFSARYISIEYHKGNIYKANVYFNTVFWADCVLGGIILFFSLGVIGLLDHFLTIPIELVSDVKLLFLLDTCNFLIVSCSTVFMTSTIIENRLDISGLIKCLSYLAEGVFLFLAYLLLNPRIFYVGIGLIVSSVVILLLNIYITDSYTPELSLKRGCFSKFDLKILVGAGLWNSINSIGNTLNSGLDLLFCNIFLSAVRAGQLAIVKTIYMIFSTMYQLVAQPFQPLQLKYYAEGNKEKLVESFKFGIKLNGMLTNVAFAGFFVFGKVYYMLWTPTQEISVLQAISVITISGCLIEGAVYPLFYIYTLTVKNKIPCYITLLSGFFNVAGMYVLINYFSSDVYGVVGTTAVLTWLVNFVFNPCYSAHCLGLKNTVFYPTLAKHIFSGLAISIVFYMISCLYLPHNWFTLIMVAIICGAIGCVLHGTIMFNKQERQMVVNYITRILWNKKR